MQVLFGCIESKHLWGEHRAVLFICYIFIDAVRFFDNSHFWNRTVIIKAVVFTEAVRVLELAREVSHFLGNLCSKELVAVITYFCL